MPAGKVHVPVRTEGLTVMYSGCEAASEYGTGELRIDGATGLQIYKAHLMVALPGEPRPQVWTVTVVGEPKGLEQSQPVDVVDLVASEWETENGHGISFKASKIVPLHSGPARNNGSAKAESAA